MGLILDARSSNQSFGSARVVHHSWCALRLLLGQTSQIPSIYYCGHLRVLIVYVMMKRYRVKH